MRVMPAAVLGVPTNIITGFLGVGKTSAILQLLANKPTSERWAVLVNEFGEIGVDGSLFAGQHGEAGGVFIREVPGGCMCCAAGLPMQIALNQLLAKAKPDRLLIEPTGLGHPAEVLAVLQAEHYRAVLTLQPTITLVDARQLADTRYTSHDTFNQQIAIADTIIGNKLDLYQPGDQDNLIAYVKAHGQAHASVLFTQYGDIAIPVLQGANNTAALPTQAPHKHHHVQKVPHNHHSHTHTAPSKPLVADMPMPACGYVQAANSGEGYHSIGWRFAPDKVFSHSRLLSLLASLQAERMKAVFITDMGVYGYNLTPDALNETELDDCDESRMELISRNTHGELKAQLLACLLA